MEKQAELLRALGHPARLRIVQYLSEGIADDGAVHSGPTPAQNGGSRNVTEYGGSPDAPRDDISSSTCGECASSAPLRERCVCEIIPALGMEQSSVSKHLKVLRDQGIVEARKEGTRIFYRLTDERVVDLVRLAESLCMAQLSRLQQLIEQSQSRSQQRH